MSHYIFRLRRGHFWSNFGNKKLISHKANCCEPFLKMSGWHCWELSSAALKQISSFVSICSKVLSVYCIFRDCAKEIMAAGAGGSRPRPGPFSNAPH